MCIIFFGRWKKGLFITFNRDEFYLRETQSLSLIDESFAINNSFSKDILYSKDVPTEGTFFSVNELTGDFCFLLNNGYKNNVYITNTKLKRGHIPLEFCSLLPNNNSEDLYFKDIQKYIDQLSKDDKEYNGYNIIFGNMNLELIYYYTNNKSYIETNIKDFKFPYQFDLSKEGNVFGLSNRSLFETFDKVNYGIEIIKDIISQDIKETKDFINEIFSKVMCNNKKFEKDDTLKDAILQNNKIKKINLTDSHIVDIKTYICSSIFVEDSFKDIIYCNYGSKQSYFLHSDKKGINIFENYGYFHEVSSEDNIITLDKTRYNKGYEQKKYINNINK